MEDRHEAQTQSQNRLFEEATPLPTKKKKVRLIRSPLLGIPLGEPVKLPDGTYCVRVKKPKGSEVEEIPLDQIVAMVVITANETPQAAPPTN